MAMINFKGMTDEERLKWKARTMAKIAAGDRHEVAAEIEEYKAYLCSRLEG